MRRSARRRRRPSPPDPLPLSRERKSSKHSDPLKSLRWGTGAGGPASILEDALTVGDRQPLHSTVSSSSIVDMFSAIAVSVLVVAVFLFAPAVLLALLLRLVTPARDVVRPARAPAPSGGRLYALSAAGPVASSGGRNVS